MERLRRSTFYDAKQAPEEKVRAWLLLLAPVEQRRAVQSRLAASNSHPSVPAVQLVTGVMFPPSFVPSCSWPTSIRLWALACTPSLRLLLTGSATAVAWTLLPCSRGR